MTTRHVEIIPDKCCEKVLFVVPLKMYGLSEVFIKGWTYAYCNRCQTIYTRRK